MAEVNVQGSFFNYLDTLLTFCKKPHRKIPHRFLEKSILRKNFVQGINYSVYGDGSFARRKAHMAKRSARLHKFARN